MSTLSSSQSSPQSSSRSSDEAILLREIHSPGVVVLTLNHPTQYNALSEEMLAALQREVDEITARDDIKVLILAAHGKAFCAGHDLKEMRAHPEQSYYEALFAQCSRLMVALARMPQIVVARVQGKIGRAHV